MKGARFAAMARERRRAGAVDAVDPVLQFHLTGRLRTRRQTSVGGEGVGEDLGRDLGRDRSQPSRPGGGLGWLRDCVGFRGQKLKSS